MAVSSSFARILAAGRPQFNARVAEARRRVPGFVAEDFAAFLEDGVDAVVAAVDKVAPGRTAMVALAAFDTALVLAAQGFADRAERNAVVRGLWRDVLPRLAARVAESPSETIGALSNAAIRLAAVPGVRTGEWLAALGATGPDAGSLAQLLDLGKVLAWRCGAAHFRAGALAAADALPEKLALAAVGGNRHPREGEDPRLPIRHPREGADPRPPIRHPHEGEDPRLPTRHPREGGDPRLPIRHPREGGDPRLPEQAANAAASWPETRAAFLADPWWSPASQADRQRDVGAFTGFGGSFPQPPQLRAAADGFWVRSGERYGLLVADAWGAVVLPATAAEFDGAPVPEKPRSPVQKGGSLVFAQRTVDLDLPSPGLQLVANAHTLAVASPYSHTVRLFALQ